MAEQNTTTTEGEGAQAAQPSVDELMAQVKSLTEERDKAVEQSRKWEGRSKSNAAAAKRLEELENASKTDAEKLADATKRAEEAEAKVAEFERKAEVAGIVREVATEKEVDAELLSRMSGSTKDEVEANADLILAKMAGSRSYPSITDGGSKRSTPITKEQIEAIKDPRERVRARARNINLYKKNGAK